MAKKKPVQTTQNRAGVPLHVRINPAIDQALATYLESSDPEIKKTAAVESALKEFLAEKGFWPPPAGDPEDD